MTEAKEWFDSNFAKMQGRQRCCDEDMGGSHYHCGNCGKVSSMMGHYIGPINRRDMAKRFKKPMGFKGFWCEKKKDD